MITTIIEHSIAKLWRQKWKFKTQLHSVPVFNREQRHEAVLGTQNNQSTQLAKTSTQHCALHVKIGSCRHPKARSRNRWAHCKSKGRKNISSAARRRNMWAHCKSKGRKNKSMKWGRLSGFPPQGFQVALQAATNSLLVLYTFVARLLVGCSLVGR
eukprot:1145626-Pelagomonas_calceolata.AAC.3